MTSSAMRILGLCCVAATAVGCAATPTPTVTPASPATVTVTTQASASTSPAATSASVSPTSEAASPTSPASEDPSATVAGPSAPNAAPTDLHVEKPALSVKSASDAANVADLGPEFQTFVIEQLKQSQSGDCHPELTVEAWRADGWARGGISGCGGAELIWHRMPDGQWKEVWGAQDVTPCSDLRDVEVPVGIAPEECTEDGKVVAYKGP